MSKKLNFFFLALLILSFQNNSAQLGFCAGNSGDPIFIETFGTGSTNGPALPTGVTTYTYVNGQPLDGSYTISSRTNYLDWFNTNDHTSGDSNGKAFIVNASFTPGEFFKRTITGLCENTTYEFSSWLINLLPASGCGSNGIPINVRFQIWDETNTTLLATGDTGNIPSKSSPVWEQYALVFQTKSGQTSVILKMLNNGAGGCGNDLAIDDIVFKTCGDNVSISNSSNATATVICEEDTPVSTTLTVNPDFSVYGTHAYQWQESADRVIWTDIAGENNENFTPPLSNTSYYRVKVAEDAINLANDKCNTVSDIFEIIIEEAPQPPTNLGNVSLCMDNPGSVEVSVPSNINVNWYDAAIGGNLLKENSVFYETTISGTYYAEAISPITSCSSQTRTAVTINYNKLPKVIDEELQFCKNDSITLSSNIMNVSYNWNTGEKTSEITVSEPGTYTVTVTDNNQCSATKTIVLTAIETQKIISTTSIHRTIVINMDNFLTYEYSLDEVNFQRSNRFENIKGGSYVVYARSLLGCGIEKYPFIHLVIPRFITPNGDGINDFFIPEGITSANNYKISIFNRFGNMIASSNNINFSWNGQFNNRILPASDYWYNIQIDDKVFNGHFTLKR